MTFDLNDPWRNVPPDWEDILNQDEEEREEEYDYYNDDNYFNHPELGLILDVDHCHRNEWFNREK